MISVTEPSQDQLQLRPFERADDATLSSWFGTAGELRFFAGRRLSWPVDSVQWDSLRADPQVSAWTAFIGNSTVPVGHGELVEKSRFVVGIERVAIAPGARGQGWGRAITGALLDKARLGGYACIRQFIHRENTSALRLLRGFGFHAIPADDERGPVLMELFCNESVGQ